MKKIFFALLALSGILVISSFAKQQDTITGAWQRADGSVQEVLIFQDGYFTHSTYDRNNRKFVQSKGGTYTQNGAQLHTRIEFSTAQSKIIGEAIKKELLSWMNELTTNN